MQHFKSVSRYMQQGLNAPRSIDATAEEFGGLSLVEIELPAHLGDVVGIDVGGIHLALDQTNQFAVAVAMLTVQNDSTASMAKVARVEPLRSTRKFLKVRRESG